MSNIEAVICVVLLFMAVPDLCRKLGRPALVFPVFVLFGLALSPLVNEGIRTMLRQAGEVGFLLLLFEVGLEIDLPPLREFSRPLRHAAGWALIQYPAVFGVGWLAGLSWMQCLLAAAALTACSVGMSHPAWKHYPGLDANTKTFALNFMVALEMLAVVVLALESTALDRGVSWMMLVRLAGIAATVFLIARFASHLENLFQIILDRTTHWRVHWIVLLVLLTCAAGERLGLDAAKTAFFLGLALSGARHSGVSLEEHIAPVSHRFLIPVFFVALGLQIDWRVLGGWDTLLAAGAAGLLLGLREIMHRRLSKMGSDRKAYLLFCPNLTIVALAANTMIEHGADSRLMAWLVMTGLFMTVPALLMLPSGIAGNSADITPPLIEPKPGQKNP